MTSRRPGTGRREVTAGDGGGSRTGAPDAPAVVLRGAEELVDALPHLLGFHPEDSLVLVAVHRNGGRLGGRVRAPIPESPADWPRAAEAVADCLLEGSRRREGVPASAVLYLCRDPRSGESPRQVMERLRPFAALLRSSCAALAVPVHRALCLSGDRYWPYTGPEVSDWPPEGVSRPRPGHSELAAVSVLAGVPMPPTRSEMERRIAPARGAAAEDQLRALDEALAAMAPRVLGDEAGLTLLREETVDLVRRLVGRFRRGGVEPRRGSPAMADTRDDALLSSVEAASLILGLQDRETRDRAAEWQEGADGRAALRLWRALSRRCVAEYGVHAAAPLTLVGWVAWSLGDEVEARIALARALETDPRCLMAGLLHHALNEGLDPEPLRRSLRSRRSFARD
ncbi:DUF4192 domain-containing protein [Streptomyces sp. ST2-7A]|uniref:DUF4192 domain-containing protein n=1 Tax=Streptomyces sp. ST2-7A TaxID=2907214 RepID=UPI001F3195F9|nr:DUF4192 domain-containing protein [Streptomyces sp. ST2-7A]MCE7081244.1 DUF4192 domain-containing protein [Streptomyces sp. ST2-7A]